MAKSPTGFHHGLHSSTRGDAALYAVAARVPTPRDDKKNTRPKINTQHVRAKTGWRRLEQVYGQGYERHRGYTEQI